VLYLLLGAAFFVLETSNVVRMALLFGSTWWVNTVVFAGILVLVLLANLTAARFRVLLALGILLAAIVPSDLLLALDPPAHALAAVVVYFGGLIFARLIENESHLYEALRLECSRRVIGGGRRIPLADLRLPLPAGDRSQSLKVVTTNSPFETLSL